MDLFRRILLAIFFLISCGNSTVYGEDEQNPINADRPGIADSSNVVNPSTLQIETGIQREIHHPSGTKETDLFFPTLFRYGIMQDAELRIEGNTFQHSSNTDLSGTSATTTGMTPTSIGGKYHLPTSISTDDLSFGIISRVFPSWGSNNFRSENTTWDLRFASDWTITKNLSLNPNIGIARYEDDSQTLFTAGLAAATLGYNISESLNVFIDSGIQFPETKDGLTAVTYDTGVAYILTPDIQLDFSIGWGGQGQSVPSVFWSTGLSIRI